MSKEKRVELPTDEQLIELYRNIKKHCIPGCRNCKFKLFECDRYIECQVFNLIKSLSGSPYEWNIEEIERIIKL